MDAKEIRKQLQFYLCGSMNLDDFEDWIAQASWNMHQDADDETQQFVGAIELRLAEYSSGHLTEDDLRHEFSMFLVHGHKLPTATMIIIQRIPAPSTTALSSTSPETPLRETITIGSPLVTSAETRSASGRAVESHEALQRAS